MLRNAIRTLVDHIEPIDTLENEHKISTLAWIDSGAELFRISKPANPPKHLVSYFVVVDSDARKVLLVDHIKAQMWLPSGGHVEINEHPKVTVNREIQEELNIDADYLMDNPLFLTVTETVGLTAGHVDVSLWYVVKGDSSVNYVYDESEFNGVEWFDYDALPEKIEPYLHRFMNKLKKTDL